MQFGFGVLSQVVRQVMHRFFPSQHTGVLKGQERDIALEVSRLYELMGRSYFYSQETLPIMYYILAFVNTAEKAGSSAELASSYAGMAILAGFAQLHSLADTYVRRALEIAEEVNDPSNLITVSVLTSVYQITVGKWDEIRARAEKAKAICEQLGDYRQWGDSVVVLAESALIAGDIQYALNTQKILIEDARRRRNPLQQCWALFGLAANSIRLGNEAIVIPMLEEALQILEEIPNLASSINTNGQLALAHLRLGQSEQALAYASRVIDLAYDISPTVYSMGVGFGAVAEVYFELWERALYDPARKLDADKYQSLAEKAIKLLRGFQKVFPIGHAPAYYYQGRYAWLTGKREGAIAFWRKGLDAAQKYNLPYEEGLIRVKLGTALKDNTVGRAVQIFERMGAVYELRSAKRAEAEITHL
jgi:tetratricopeptide (TPR) repeat protein